MSIDVGGPLRHDDAVASDGREVDGSSSMLNAQQAAEFARVLIEKYGADALTYAHDRAQRAVDVGDELALDAWHDVIAATQGLLQRIASV
jgi:hypothetical protein